MVFERVKEFVSALLGNKNLPKSVRNVLKRDGDKFITELEVVRNPIRRIGRDIINFLSLGKFDELLKKYSYDDLFHLALHITLEDGKKLLFEKNQTLNLSSNVDSNKTKDEERITIPLSETISLNEFVDNTRKKQGDKKFFSYNPFTNNCQDMILDALSSNGLLTPKARSFIKQDTEELVNELPSFSKYISEKLVDVAGTADQAVQELTMRRGGKVGSYTSQRRV